MSKNWVSPQDLKLVLVFCIGLPDWLLGDPRHAWREDQNLQENLSLDGKKPVKHPWKSGPASDFSVVKKPMDSWFWMLTIHLEKDDSSMTTCRCLARCSSRCGLWCGRHVPAAEAWRNWSRVLRYTWVFQFGSAIPNGAFHKWGTPTMVTVGLKLLKWKITLKWMMTGGTPMTKRKPPNEPWNTAFQWGNVTSKSGFSPSQWDRSPHLGKSPARATPSYATKGGKHAETVFSCLPRLSGTWWFDGWWEYAKRIGSSYLLFRYHWKFDHVGLLQGGHPEFPNMETGNRKNVVSAFSMKVLQSLRSSTGRCAF